MAIRSFRDIPLTYEKRTLIICDIDDTLIKWEKTLQSFYNQSLVLFSTSGTTGNTLHLLAKRYAIQLYNTYRQKVPPTPTDPQGFIDLMQRITLIPGSEIIFLTARTDCDNITRQDFATIGLRYDQFKVYFTANQISKGEYIQQKINAALFDHVIFIDDLMENIISVNRFCPTIECYRFLST